MNQVKEAKYIGSVVDQSKAPKPDMPEHALIGRSNVGKSSLINMLCSRKTLAKISVTPGKTRTINHFLIDNQWYLADLPGYGYAKISKTEREKWEKMIWNFLKRRPNLVNTFILIDVRLKPQKIDIEFINKMGEHGLPFSLVFTKVDKVGAAAADASVEVFKNELRQYWDQLPEYFISSSKSGLGREEILGWISSTNEEVRQDPGFLSSINT
ncbi:MAG: ribosome biogenesis GTP-binding protein YihA/YsxC [Bacteroidales bacterium]|jgi:GTP-binding protein|nr:ribosome biogenesis GTP-binding protein YihA/YsxC [Bacteroidales bacterium]